MSLLLTLKLFYFTPCSSFSMLTLNKWMLAGICCIQFHIYRSSYSEVFFKKGVLHLASLQENIHAEVWIQLYLNHTFLYGYSSKNSSRTPFLENTSGEIILCTVFNIELINLEVFHKQVKIPCLTLNVIFARPEAAIVVDKTRKRSEVYVRLVSEL